MNYRDVRLKRTGQWLKGVLLILLMPVLVSCALSSNNALGQGGPTVGGPPPMPAEVRVEKPVGIKVEIVVQNLEIPWSIDFAPDGRVFITERPGRIRIIKDDRLQNEAWATIGVRHSGEGGLMGFVLDPDFSSNGYAYACYTYQDGGETGNRVVRMVERGGRGSIDKTLVDKIPGAFVHDGCRLKIGPDKKLYITTGDARQPNIAQDQKSLGGKILRLNLDGTIPSDNPFSDSPVYSFGHRNPQGIGWQPKTGVLFETEHGPSGEFGIGGNDEVNRITPGGNYGWPVTIGAPGLRDYIDPILLYNPAVAPSGMAFYNADLIPQWRGNLFFATLRGESLYRVILDDVGSKVVGLERIFPGVYGRLRDVAVGPEGALYVLTNNRDGRGFPRSGDDKLLRLVPGN